MKITFDKITIDKITIEDKSFDDDIKDMLIQSIIDYYAKPMDDTTDDVDNVPADDLDNDPLVDLFAFKNGGKMFDQDVSKDKPTKEDLKPKKPNKTRKPRKDKGTSRPARMDSACYKIFGKKMKDLTKDEMSTYKSIMASKNTRKIYFN